MGEAGDFEFRLFGFWAGFEFVSWGLVDFLEFEFVDSDEWGLVGGGLACGVYFLCAFVFWDFYRSRNSTRRSLAFKIFLRWSDRSIAMSVFKSSSVKSNMSIPSMAISSIGVRMGIW